MREGRGSRVEGRESGIADRASFIERRSTTDYRLSTILLLLLLAACSPERRYQILSHIFDGVPPPGTVQAEPPRQDALLPPVPSAGQAPFAAPQYFASVHQPYADRRCEQCHALDEMGLPVLPDQIGCLRCHGEEALREGWDHGPAAFGVCRACHDPHLSIHTHLTIEAQPALCTACHSSVSLMTAVSAHLGQETKRCTDCHDPHRRGLLVATPERGAVP
jgi:predicted CXXCH cytochrome family protein